MGLKRDLAIFTICQNEPKFLPVWTSYYRKQTNPDDIFVLDHDSCDITTVATANTLHRVPVHRAESFDHNWLRTVVQSFQRFLLQSYRWVLFAECDEIVAANPEVYTNLLDFVRTERLCSGAEKGQLHPAWVRAKGYELVQLEEEPVINWESPLLAQRDHWAPSKLYSKTLLANRPLEWSKGFHTTDTLPTDPHEDLVLIHLHRLDFEYCKQKHKESAARVWSAEDLANGCGLQNRLADEEKLRKWFWHPEQLGNDFEPLNLEHIPQRWKGVI